MRTFLSNIAPLIWSGIWQGFGVELSFIVLWGLWRTTHRKVAHKLDPEHWFHSISEYYAGTVGHVSEATVKKYIENQKGR